MHNKCTFEHNKEFCLKFLRITVLRKKKKNWRDFGAQSLLILIFLSETWLKQWLVIINGFKTKPKVLPLGEWRYVTQSFIINVYFIYFIFNIMMFSSSFFLSFVELRVKYRFVTTLCKLLVYNCDISPSHDKYSSPSGFIAKWCLGPQQCKAHWI